MAASRFGVGNTQDEPGEFYGARKSSVKKKGGVVNGCM